MRADQARVVLLSVPRQAAERLVRTLVEERLAACGSILGAARSVYRWQGEVESADESIVIIKTTSAAVPRLLERVPALHPYDVAEVLVLPVAAGLQAYLDWLGESVDTTVE